MKKIIFISFSYFLFFGCQHKKSNNFLKPEKNTLIKKTIIKNNKSLVNRKIKSIKIEEQEVEKIDFNNNISLYISEKYNKNYIYTIIKSYKKDSLIQKKTLVKACKNCTNNDLFSIIWFPSNENSDYDFKIVYFTPTKDNSMLSIDDKEKIVRVEYWKITKKGNFETTIINK